MRRRGVSPVVAELLMLAITVSLGSFVYVYSTTAFSGFGSGFSALVSNQGSALSESVVVEQVAFTDCPGGSGQQACVFVRNVGSLVATVASVYVNDITAGTFVGYESVNAQILVGQFKPIPVAISGFAVQPGHAYRFTIATSRGNAVITNAVG